MNLKTIHESLFQYLNKEHSFVYYGSRGYVEKFQGKIIQIFPRIFLVLTDDSKIKSFSYSDFAIKCLIIY